MFSFVVVDELNVFDTAKLGTGDDVVKFVDSVSCDITYADGDNSITVTEVIFLNPPQGVFSPSYIAFDDLKRSDVENMIKKEYLLDRRGNTIRRRLNAQVIGVSTVDAPWKE